MPKPLTAKRTSTSLTLPLGSMPDAGSTKGPPPLRTDTLFPSVEHQQDLRRRFLKDGIETFDQFELWYWHAYTYAFRRVALNAFEFTSPVDPDGRWYGEDHVRAAERYYRKRLGKPVRAFHPRAAAQDGVRDNCRSISAHDLSDAEHRIVDPEIAALAERARLNVARAEAKWRAAFRDKNTRYEARAGIERSLAAAPLDPVTAAELMERVGGYAIATGERS